METFLTQLDTYSEISPDSTTALVLRDFTSIPTYTLSPLSFTGPWIGTFSFLESGGNITPVHKKGSKK